MGNKKIIMLVGSILLGALAGFALLGYVRGVRDEVLDDVSRVPVWVVSGPIAEGTTAASAQSTARLELSEIESSFRPANAITDLTQIEGQVAASDLVENQILLAGSFADPSVVETTFASQIAPNHVAINISVPLTRAVNGNLSPGDFVDIIVLGDAPVQPGEGDVFETSLQASPYERPARTLFRGVRIESINDDVLGVPVDETAAAAVEEEIEVLEIGLAVPSSAVQRILSVSPDDIVLGLLPPDWVPEQQINEVTEAIIVNEDLPGENPLIVTPYGADGFVDFLAEELGADGAPATDDVAVTDADLFPETDPVEEDTEEADEDGDEEAATDEEGQ